VLPRSDVIRDYYSLSITQDILLGLSDEEIKRHARPHRFDPILTYITKKAGLSLNAPLRFLDVGAGNGRLINAARTHTNWRNYALEPNPTKIQTMLRLGIEAVEGEIEHKYSSFPSSGMSIVTMTRVLEHLLSPRQAIQRVKNLMAPGGVLWIDVPNCTDAYFCSRTSDNAPHLTFWTSDSLEAFGRQEGFDVLACGSFGDPIPLGLDLRSRFKSSLKHGLAWSLPTLLLNWIRKPVSSRGGTPTCERVLTSDYLGRVAEVPLYDGDWTRTKLFILLSRVMDD
jgi:SAM-dependent methyltransferase